MSFESAYYSKYLFFLNKKFNYLNYANIYIFTDRIIFET